VGEEKLCRPVKMCPGPVPVCGLVVGKCWARGSLTFHKANVPAFLLLAAMLSPFLQNVREL
jgi:hypothetical protein